MSYNIIDRENEMWTNKDQSYIVFSYGKRTFDSQEWELWFDYEQNFYWCIDGDGNPSFFCCISDLKDFFDMFHEKIDEEIWNLRRVIEYDINEAGEGSVHVSIDQIKDYISICEAKEEALSAFNKAKKVFKRKELNLLPIPEEDEEEEEE